MTGAPASIPAPRDLRDLVHTRARHSPESIALLAPGRPPLTYGGLALEVDRVARTLSGMGVGRGDRVALLLPDGPEMVVAVLAAAAIGACAPLNPASTAHELARLFDRLEPVALVVARDVDSPARAVAGARDMALLELSPLPDGAAGAVALSAGGRRRPAARDDGGAAGDLALVLVTSGTTAQPKIVPLSHPIVCTAARDMARALGLGPDDRLLSVMPLFHSHGLVSTVLASLVAGASVVCTPGFSRSAFFDWMAAFGPTWYSAVPTIHQMILSAAPAPPALARGRRLRFIRSSSAALAPPVLAELERVFGAPVIEAYGTTEASSIACNPLPPRRRRAGSVGISTGPEIAIVDEAGERAGAGTIGEIVVRGPSVLSSYGDAAADAPAFARGWFRTGDLGTVDADGYLFIAGRLADVVNRGGMKVAPLEVDAAFLEHPAVAEAATFGVPHARWGEDVITAVVLRRGAAATERELRAFAATRLATFKVPSQVCIVEALPTGPTGKVERRTLGDRLGVSAPPRDDAGAADETRTPLETVLARLMATVLGRARVKRDDSFFRLGGDSLLAMQLLSRIREGTSMEVSFASFFEHPTVAELSELLVRQQVGTLALDELAHVLAALERLGDGAAPGDRFRA